jgi:hypothetical protein
MFGVARTVSRQTAARNFHASAAASAKLGVEDLAAKKDLKVRD